MTVTNVGPGGMLPVGPNDNDYNGMTSHDTPTPGDKLLVLCTCPDTGTAMGIGARLVDERLAACVNVLPGLTSIYRWQGKREQASEALLLIKTTTARYAALEETIVHNHPYELPEVVAVPLARGLPAYLDWIDDMTTKE